MNSYQLSIEDFTIDDMSLTKKMCFKNMCLALMNGDNDKGRYWFKLYKSIVEE